VIPLSGLMYYVFQPEKEFHANYEPGKEIPAPGSNSKKITSDRVNASENIITNVKKGKQEIKKPYKDQKKNIYPASQDPMITLKNKVIAEEANNQPLLKQYSMSHNLASSNNVGKPVNRKEKDFILKRTSIQPSNEIDIADKSIDKAYMASFNHIHSLFFIRSIDDFVYKKEFADQLNSLSSNERTEAEKRAIIHIKKRSFFYTGIYAGGDLNFVGPQGTSSPGYSFGVRIGYHFGGKLSVETGTIFDKKYYYSEGKYFNKSSLSYLNHVTILSLKGNCNMIEIPLNFKYDFYQGKRGAWSVATGMSSYFMTKEYYDYNYEYYGTYGEKGYTYRNSSKKWFSIINFSLGYQQDLGKSFVWRIEPYFKLPVSGVGLGSLSLNSAGIYIGISKRIN
jgi:hypothetical protein